MLLIFAFGLILTPRAIGSAESENEPSRDQFDIIDRSITALQQSGVPELNNSYDPEENTSYYLRDISFLERFPSTLGPLALIRCVFTRGSPYRDGATTPPQGHSFVIALDDSLHYLAHCKIDSEARIEISEGKVSVIDPASGEKTRANASLFDLNTLRKRK